MSDCLSQSYDFGIRIVQLSRWLKDEGKDFPLSGRLLECGAGICPALRVAQAMGDKGSRVVAFRYVEEAEYLLELMVETDFITALQSEPLLSDCRVIKKDIRANQSKRKKQSDGSDADNGK